MNWKVKWSPIPLLHFLRFLPSSSDSSSLPVVEVHLLNHNQIQDRILEAPHQFLHSRQLCYKFLPNLRIIFMNLIKHFNHIPFVSGSGFGILELFESHEFWTEIISEPVSHLAYAFSSSLQVVAKHLVQILKWIISISAEILKDPKEGRVKHDVKHLSETRCSVHLIQTRIFLESLWYFLALYEVTSPHKSNSIPV